MPFSKSGSPTSLNSPGFPEGTGSPGAPPLSPGRPHPASPGKARVWILAARPATLPAAVAPVVVASAAALGLGRFSFPVFLAALVGAMLIQIGTNFANDLFDFKKGADTEERLGPVRATQAGLLSEQQVARGAWVTFGLAFLIGLYLVAVGGWPVLAVGVAGIVAGILYTGGPWPLGYHGLGDVFVFLFFGLAAVATTFYLHTGYVDGLAWWMAVAMGALTTAILVVNNLRDIPTDRRAGKRTLAVRLGPRLTRVQYALLVILAYLVPLLLWRQGHLSGLWWLPWLSLPLAVGQMWTVFTQEGRALNRALKGTGQMLLAYALLMAIALVS